MSATLKTVFSRRKFTKFMNRLSFSFEERLWSVVLTEAHFIISTLSSSAYVLKFFGKLLLLTS